MTTSDDISVYSLLRDFAGPLATVFAATVAALITFHFNKRQTIIAAAQRDIAASQRDIAKDKLKVDLFKERYAIYSAAKTLIDSAANLRDADDVMRHTAEFRKLYIALDEARFFFDAKVRAFLNKLHDDVESFLTDLSADVDVDDAAAWSARAERLAHKNAILRQVYADLPKMFEGALEFTQLTRTAGDA